MILEDFVVYRFLYILFVTVGGRYSVTRARLPYRGLFFGVESNLVLDFEAY
jgi:hypothetical protein